MLRLIKPAFYKQTPTTFIRMTSNNSNPVTVLGGHTQYAKGYVEETIGNVAGSKEWQESGQKDAKAGIDEMKVCCSHDVHIFEMQLMMQSLT
jgi:hypothetical protein